MQRNCSLAMIAAVLAVGAFLPLTAFAQEMAGPKQDCSAGTVLPPAALAGWTSKAALTSAAGVAALDKSVLTPGTAATVHLNPTRSVAYVTQPEKPGGSVAHGGLLAVTIAAPGTYQVSLSSGAWIDLLKDGAAQMSTAHAPGPACTGIRKTVQFSLQPGRYVLQISANADPEIQVMVSKVS